MAAASSASPGPRYAPFDPTLPKPWKGLVDGKTGYLYFWNTETNVTQYERPSSSTSEVPKSTSLSSSIHVHHASSPSAHDHGKHSHESDAGIRCNGMENDASKRLGTHSSHGYQSSRGGSYHQDVLNGPGRDGHEVTNTYSHAPLKVSTRMHPSSGGTLSVESYCQQHEITVMGSGVPPPFMTFESTGFPSEILREVHHAGFSVPTPIQAQSWPVALQGRDIVAIAKTGSGKTLGYLIPGFVHLKRQRNSNQMGPTVLVLSPTRELATQIQDEAVKFGKSSRISCTCLYGGAPKGPQLRDLEKGTDIVVATPGRLNDILEMKRISLHQVSYLVLDEADRMLDMGFEPQIRKIVNEVPPRRQTLMYTATWPKEVRKIAADLLVSPVQVNIGKIDELVANKAITQYVEVVPPMEKQRRLEQILRSQEPGSKVIVFCSTKKMCDQLARMLTRQFGAAAIHGDKSQGERDWVLGQFRSGRSPILVATDVAARGLDIKDIRVVINYDFPTGIEDYVHRIGRTGRAGATGEAYTFFSDQDAKYASDLVKVLEGADQRVPTEIRNMVGHTGGRFLRHWSSSGGRAGGVGRNDDRGGRGAALSSGRWADSGRGTGHYDRDSYGRCGRRGYEVESRGRFSESDNRMHKGHVRSPSPRRGAGIESSRRSRSRSRSGSHATRSRSRSLDRLNQQGSFVPWAKRAESPKVFNQSASLENRDFTWSSPVQRSFNSEVGSKQDRDDGIVRRSLNGGCDSPAPPTDYPY